MFKHCCKVLPNTPSGPLACVLEEFGCRAPSRMKRVSDLAAAAEQLESDRNALNVVTSTLETHHFQQRLLKVLSQVPIPSPTHEARYVLKGLLLQS